MSASGRVAAAAQVSRAAVAGAVGGRTGETLRSRVVVDTRSSVLGRSPSRDHARRRLAGHRSVRRRRQCGSSETPTEEAPAFTPGERSRGRILWNRRSRSDGRSPQRAEVPGTGSRSAAESRGQRVSAQRISIRSRCANARVRRRSLGDFETNWEAIRTQLEADDQHWASAHRYSFEIIVETPESILTQSDRVEPDQLFGQGITLHSSELLDRVKREILSDG
ncbi:MAG: hypothetical protein V5A82_08925 [Haloferacaceae archaeon]